MAELLDTTVNGNLIVTGQFSLPNHSDVDKELTRTINSDSISCTVEGSTDWTYACSFTLPAGAWMLSGMINCAVSTDNKRIGARFVITYASPATSGVAQYTYEDVTQYCGAQYLSTNSATNTYHAGCRGLVQSKYAMTVNCYAVQTSSSDKSGTFYYGALRLG